MIDDPAPVEPGTLGTVTCEPVSVAGRLVVGVSWDNGRTLNVVSPPDKYEEVPTLKAPEAKR